MIWALSVRSVPGQRDMGMPPSVADTKITDRLHPRNEERTFAQAFGTLFQLLLRKEHEIASGLPNAWRAHCEKAEL